MKFHDDVKKFKPITITLETEAEARLIRTLVGNCSGQSCELRKFIDDLWEGLKERNVYSYPHDNPIFDLDTLSPGELV